MPAIGKGARLYLRKERRKPDGSIHTRSVWVIRDGGHEESTGCGPRDLAAAERALTDYLNRRHTKASAQGLRRADSIPVADVIGHYATVVGPKVARPADLAIRGASLMAFFGDKMLSEINGRSCREYVAQRAYQSAARRELEDLRAAINLHRREGLCREVVEVTLPEASQGRERWLTRSEAARLIWAAWRYREQQNRRATDRYTRRHVARFILVALYTGSRASVITSAALKQTEGRGWIDLERGVFYRRAEGQQETKKRAPAIRLPDRLLAHLRRWKRLGARYAVEWNRRPVASIRKAFASAVKDAGLGLDVTPHVLRHTAVTWAMQNSADRYQSGGYFGLTQEMIERRYGHHHPDHQGSVADAIVRRPPASPHHQQNEKGNIVAFGGETSRKTANG